MLLSILLCKVEDLALTGILSDGSIGLLTKELVSFKELLMSEVIQAEALVHLLERKGIVTKQELLEGFKVVQGRLQRC